MGRRISERKLTRRSVLALGAAAVMSAGASSVAARKHPRPSPSPSGTPVPTQSVTPVPVPSVSPGWSDDFVDLSQWTAKVFVYDPTFRVDSTQVSVAGGILKIREDFEGAGAYVSGMLLSNREFDHGYFEARINYPMGTAFDCAFWLRRPEAISPPRTEIDIIEAYPNNPYQYPGPNKYQATMHYISGGSLVAHQITYDSGHDLTNTWHVVGCDWVPNERITYYFDDICIGTIWADVLPLTTMNIVLSLGVGETGISADGSTPATATMLVDWVRWWEVKPTNLANRYDAAVVLDGPTAYWHLGESAGLFVDSVAALAGTPAGGVTRGVASPIAGADPCVTFNGTTGTIDIPDSVAINPGAICSFEFWAKRADAATGYQLIWSKGNQGNVFFVNNKLTLDNTSVTIAESTGTVTDTNWHHYVVTHNGTGTGNTAFYKDGQPWAITEVNIGAALTVSSGFDARIGEYWPNGGGTLFFNGSVEALAIYSSVMPASRVLAHYNAAL